MSEGGRMNARKRLHREGIAKNMSEGRNLVTARQCATSVMIGIRADISGREGAAMCEECNETTQSVAAAPHHKVASCPNGFNLNDRTTLFPEILLGETVSVG